MGGEVSEWFKELVLKTSVGNTTVGSNPTLSAIHDPPILTSYAPLR